jgi:hypothetical protein
VDHRRPHIFSSQSKMAHLLRATTALHAAVVQYRDEQDDLASWSLQSIRAMRGGVQRALEWLTHEDELFAGADDTFEGYSDAELRDMLVGVRHSSSQLATLRAVSPLPTPALVRSAFVAMHEASSSGSG